MRRPVSRALSSVSPALMALLVAASAALVAVAAAHAQQPQTRIGVDANSEGNTATSLGAIDECFEIGLGDTHTVDIFVENVTDLQAWEAVLAFDPEVLEIVDWDMQYFQAANAGSDVVDISGELPPETGLVQLAAFDSADPPSPDSGSGVLARVTVKGAGPGVSELDLPLLDLDDDGAPDRGPLLRDVEANVIGDVTGDTLFDGPIVSARIAVDASCNDPTGALQAAEGSGNEPEGNNSDGIGVITIIALAIGFIGAIAVGGLSATLFSRRNQGS